MGVFRTPILPHSHTTILRFDPPAVVHRLDDLVDREYLRGQAVTHVTALGQCAYLVERAGYLLVDDGVCLLFIRQTAGFRLPPLDI